MLPKDMKYSIVLLLILCITAHATPDMKKRLLKGKMKHAKQHAQHELGAPKLRAGEVAWADPAVCTSTNDGALDSLGDGCKDEDDGDYPYDNQPVHCTSEYNDTDFQAMNMCCGCGGGDCQEGYQKAVYANYSGMAIITWSPYDSSLIGTSRLEGIPLCCADADVDACGICHGDNSTCLDDCGVPNGSNACHDDCGVPNGNNACHDACGVPNGDDSTCSYLLFTNTNAGCQVAKDYYNDQCSC